MIYIYICIWLGGFYRIFMEYLWNIMVISMEYLESMISGLVGGGIPTPLKNYESQLG